MKHLLILILFVLMSCGSGVPTNDSGGGDENENNIDIKYVFVTSEEYDGNLGGLDGADAKCQALADDAELGGTYVAWLSDSITDAKDSFDSNSGPWYLVDGITKIADNLTILTSGTIDSQIIKDQNGNNLGTNIYVFTATDVNGLKDEDVTFCSDWNINNTSNVQIGRADILGPMWTNVADIGSPCSLKRHLYCFEQ